METSRRLAPNQVSDPGRFTEAAIAAMQVRPMFIDALRQNIRGALAYSESDRAFHSTISDIGVYFLSVLALYLDATGGLSHRQLRAYCGNGRLTSAGRATAILWQLQRAGLITPMPRRNNGLMRLYRPAPDMVAAFRARFLIDFEACAMVEPEAAKIAEAFQEEEFFALLIVQMGEGLLAAADNKDGPTMVLSDFALKNHGMLMLYALAESAFERGALRIAGPFDTTAASLSQRFGVSRSHASRMIRDAEQAGYIVGGELGSNRRLTAAFASDLQRLTAIHFLGLMAAGGRALSAHKADRANVV